MSRNVFTIVSELFYHCNWLCEIGHFWLGGQYISPLFVESSSKPGNGDSPYFSFVGVSLDQWKKTYLTTFGFFSWWNFSLIKFLKRKFVQWNLKSKYFHFREFTLMLKLFSDLGSFAAHEWIKWGGTLLCLRVSPKLSRGSILWWLWKNLVSFSSRFKINEII